jgi:protein SCO1/2
MEPLGPGRRSTKRRPASVLLSLLAATAGAWSAGCRRGGAPPPVLRELPAFTLVAEDGRAVSRDDLAGKAWIAAFIFTRCGGVCPRLGARMAGLQERLPPGGAIRLVSFTVDPEHDTPAVLARYAARLGARPELWTFLTGPPERVQGTVRDGFEARVRREEAAERGAIAAEGYAMLHTDELVLVDGRGRIRGRYLSSDDGLDRILADARRVLEVEAR